MTPLGAVARGLAAGVAGTAVMTAWQEAAARLRSGGGETGGPQGEDQPPQDPWESASAPAKVARRIGEGVFQREVPASRIGLLTNVMHWSYGTGWGAVYGLIARTWPGRPLLRGVAFGTGVWAMSYAMLVPMGLYSPPWTYPPVELGLDLSYHLAYGAGGGLAHAAITR